MKTPIQKQLNASQCAKIISAERKFKQPVTMGSENQEYGLYADLHPPLLDWDALRSADLDRHPYAVADVAVYPFKFANSEKCEVIPQVVTAAYVKGIVWAVPRCQQFYYMGMEARGSVVCEKCMRGARYALFSVYDSAYVNLLHVHSNSLANCLHCKRRIPSISVKKCECNKNEEELIRTAPMYRCIRPDFK